MYPEQEALDLDTKTKSYRELADEATKRAMYIVAQVNKYKQPRLERIQLYRDLYAGKVKRKYRQPFNVVLPVFAGTMDTLMAAFNDDLAVEFHEQEPADYIAVKKLDALWQMEVTSDKPNAKFPLKTRQDRSNALFSGRGFMMNYAASQPEYKNCFEVFEYEDAIFQPRGGGQLENHLFSGRQNIVRTKSALETGGYDKERVRELVELTGKADFYPDDDLDTQSALSKYKAMGFDTKSADYVGEPLFKLVEMVMEIDGKRYYLVFSPWYQKWVRFQPLSELSSAERLPWVSWATHEDNANFSSKSYADDSYGIADAVHTLFNQELTNREKQNLNARAYDVDIFPDVSKLDLAQTRPDALVPVDTKGGARKIAEGIYRFETPALNGTINLIEWMEATAGRDLGVTDVSKGSAESVSKKATVVFAEQQNISKRLLLRSSSYTEAMGEIGRRFIDSARDHMPAKRAIRALGAEGEGWNEITRKDLNFYSDVDIRVVSSALEIRNSQLKKEARVKELADIAADPILIKEVNPRALVEEKLRSGAEYDDAEIKVLMDTKNYGNKEEQARAHEAIQEIMRGKRPDTFYNATTLFMEIIVDFASNNRNTLKSKYDTLMDYAMSHGDIASQNMQRKAKADAAAIAEAPVSPETPPTEANPSPTVPPAIEQVSNLPALS